MGRLLDSRIRQQRAPDAVPVDKFTFQFAFAAFRKGRDALRRLARVSEDFKTLPDIRLPPDVRPPPHCLARDRFRPNRGRLGVIDARLPPGAVEMLDTPDEDGSRPARSPCRLAANRGGPGENVGRVALFVTETSRRRVATAATSSSARSRSPSAVWAAVSRRSRLS